MPKKRRQQLPPGRYLEIALGCLIREDREILEAAGPVSGEKARIHQTYRITRIHVRQPEDGVEEQEIRCCCGADLRVFVASRREVIRSAFQSVLLAVLVLGGAAAFMAVTEWTWLRSGWFFMLAAAGAGLALFWIGRKVVPFLIGEDGPAMAALTLLPATHRPADADRPFGHELLSAKTLR